MLLGVALALSLNMGSLIQNVSPVFAKVYYYYFFNIPKCVKYKFALVLQQ